MLTGEKFYVEYATGEIWCDRHVPAAVATDLHQRYGDDSIQYAILVPGALGLGEVRDSDGRFVKRPVVAARCHTCGATQQRRSS